MLPLAGMLFNVVSGLVMYKASTLAKDHVDKMLDDVLDDVNKYLKNKKNQNTEIIFVSIKKQKLFHIVN